MPVTVQVPVVEDYREVILAAGEADNITCMILVGQYIYAIAADGFGLHTPAKLLKIDKDNFATRSVLTFPSDDKHRIPLEICHSAGVIYALFQNVVTNDVPDFQLTIGRASISPTFALMSDFVDVTGVYLINNGSITTDDTYLYVIAGTVGLYAGDRKILKYALSGGAPTVADVTGFGSCHCIRYAGGKLYLTGRNFPGDARIARMTTGLVIEEAATWAVGDFAFSVNEFGMSLDAIWVSDRSTTGIVKKFTKSSLATVVDISTGQLARSTFTNFDGTNIWTLFENGRSVRFNPTSNAQGVYTLNDGQGFQSEMVGDGTYQFVAWNQVATKIVRYRIPSEPTSGAPQRFGGTRYDDGRSVAVHTDGSTYITGLFQGTVDFLGTSLTSAGTGRSIDIFVMKLNPDGTLAWVKQVAGSCTATTCASQTVKSIAVAPNGDAYITGFFDGTLTFGAQSWSSAGGNDIFLAKYSGVNGAEQWSKRFGAAGNDQGAGVAVDNAGNVVMMGMIGPGVTFGGATFPVNGNNTIFVAKFDSSGTHLFSMASGSFGTVTPGGIAIDSQNNVWVTGSFLVYIDFIGQQLNAVSEFAAVFLAKLSPSLVRLTSRRFGNQYSANAYAVAVDSQDNVVITGQTRDGVKYGDDSGPTVGDNFQYFHSYIAKYDSGGNYLWAVSVGYSTGGTSQGLAIKALPAPSRDIVVGGSFTFTVNFGNEASPRNVTSKGSSDVFIGRYSAGAGALVSLNTHGSTGADFCFGLGVLPAPATGVVATGGFVLTINFGTEADPVQLTSAGSTDAFLFPLNY